MIAAVLLAALLAGDGDAVAHWSVDTHSVEVGEPFDLTLEVSAGPEEDVLSLVDVHLRDDASFVVLGERTDPPTVSGDGDRATTRRTFTLVSLRPGERPLAELLPALPAEGGQGAGSAVDLPSIEVRSLLGEDETAPRGPHGFPDGFGSAGARANGRGTLLRGAGIGALAVLVLLFLGRVLRRGATAAKSEPSPAPLERLGRLRAEVEEGRRPGREVLVELSGLLRTAPGLGPAQPGETDEEWLQEMRRDGRLRSALAPDFEAFLAEAREVKYAGREPSPWALEENFGRAERLLAAVGAEAGRAEG